MECPPERVGTKWDKILQTTVKHHKKLFANNDYNTEISVMDALLNNQQYRACHYLMHEYFDLIEKNPRYETSSKVSSQIREEGNKIYKSESNLFEAALLYSLAIRVADDHVTLAFAFANRAAALMKLGFIKVALMDCQMAIQYHHPDPFKVYERMCALSNDSLDGMKKYLNCLEKHLDKKSKKSRDIVQQYKKRLKAMEKEEFVEDMEKIKLNTKLTNDNETDFQNIKQLSSPTAGRYVVAQKPIHKNQKIFSEAPFAFVPVVYQYSRNEVVESDCQHCGLTNCFPYFCIQCRQAAFCSPKCCE